MPAPDRKPDAVIFHSTVGNPLDRDFPARLAAANPNALYGEALGCKRLRVHPPNVPHPYYFGYPDSRAAQSLDFATDHPFHGLGRYEWYPAKFDAAGNRWAVAGAAVSGPGDNAGRVLFGWLKPEAIESDRSEAGDEPSIAGGIVAAETKVRPAGPIGETEAVDAANPATRSAAQTAAEKAEMEDPATATTEAPRDGS